MNRRLILATLLAMLLAACGQQESSEPDATLTPEATPEASSDASTPSESPPLPMTTTARAATWPTSFPTS